MSNIDVDEYPLHAINGPAFQSACETTGKAGWSDYRNQIYV